MTDAGPDPSPLEAIEARIAAGRAPELLREFRDAPPAWIAQSIHARILLARAAARTGDYQLASDLADGSRRSLAGGDGSDDASLFEALNILGGVAFERGRLDAAWGWYDQAQQVAARLGDAIAHAKVTNNMASIRHRRGDAAAAELLYRRALSSYQAAGDRRGEAEARHNLAIVHRTADRLGEALLEASEAVVVARRTGDRGLLGMALAGLAEVRIARGDGHAAEALDRASALAADAGDRLGMVETARLRGAWHLRHGRPAEAAAAAEQAREAARDLGVLLALHECTVVAAEAWESTGDARLAAVRRDEATLLGDLIDGRDAPPAPVGSG